MRKISIFILLTSAFIAFSQTQHINQLIENVLPDFIVSYNHDHKMDLSIIENEMPYLAAHSLEIKSCKYVKGKLNGGLEDGDYCNSPSFYLISKDTLRMQFFIYGAKKQFPGLRIR